MFRFLCNKVIQGRELLNGESTTKFTLGFLQTRIPIHRSISGSSSAATVAVAVADNPTHHKDSFTFSYLIYSCGFSEEKALSTSKKVQFESSTKPDSVLTLFRNHEFSDTQISTLVQKLPSLLLVNADKTLKPKLDFFKSSLGLSAPEVAKLLSYSPYILHYSLKNQIIPTLDFLKSILQTDSNVVAMLKNSPMILRKNLQKDLVPKIELLRACAVPESKILSLLKVSPFCFLLSVDRFKEIVEQVKIMGFDPLKSEFVRAVVALVRLNNSGNSFETKSTIYKRWGWSEDQIRAAFRKEPNCMVASEKKIMHNMDFFVKKMGFHPRLIAISPIVLLFSLEKRIFPRCSAMQLLISNGLIHKNYNFTQVLKLSDEKFLRKFVIQYKDQVPELLKVYGGKMNGNEPGC